MNASQWALGQYPMKNKILKIQNLKKYLDAIQVSKTSKHILFEHACFMTYIEVTWAPFFTTFIRYVHALTHDPQNLHSAKSLFQCYLHAICILLRNTSPWSKVMLKNYQKFLCFLKLTPNAFLLILKNRMPCIEWSIQTLNVCKRGT